MDLKADIENVTNLSGDELHPEFKPFKRRGCTQPHTKMNNRVRSFLSKYEEDSDAVELDDQEYDEKYLEEITFLVRAMNGGELADKRIEEHIRNKQRGHNKEANLSTSTFQRSDNMSNVSSDFYDNASISYEGFENESGDTASTFVKNVEYSKLLKNGVFRGLLNQNIISESDFNHCGTPITRDDKCETSKKIEKEEKSFSRSALVQHPNDPDILVHPLEAYGKLEYTEELVLSRIGTKTTSTPKDFLLSFDDSDFVFHKNSK